MVLLSFSPSMASFSETNFCDKRSQSILIPFPDAKRIIGLAYGDNAVREFQQKCKQFKIVNSGGYAAFEFRHEGRQMRKTPLEIAAKLLRKIRKTANRWANGCMQFEKAVITVPANFVEPQLVATIRAAEEAGFSKVHLTKEPNAGELIFGLVLFDLYRFLLKYF